jgi:hypothetical protein
MIYQQSEIDREGVITQIRFNVQDTPTNYTMPNQKIYMAHTTLSSFPNSSVEEAEESNHISSEWTLVYDGTLVWNIGWNEINLDFPFEWNNIDNLLIKVENRSGTYSWNYPGFYYTNNPGTVAYNWQDGSYPFTNGIRSSERPNIKILFESINTLPVELTEFNGENINEYNSIYWTTISELNCDFYKVYRSTDNISWELVTTTQGSGTTVYMNEYEIIDRKFQNNTINYYKLYQVDFNGETTTYGPIAINNTTSSEILKTINMMGQEVNANYKGVVIHIYSDGSIEKKLK